MRDVNSNIAGERYATNSPKKAEYSLADFINNMERSADVGVPRRLPQEWGRLNTLIKELDASGSYDTTELKRIRDELKIYPMHEPVLDKNHPAHKMMIFDLNGDLLTFEEAKKKPALSGIATEADYEHMRRLIITMMEANPEWDWDGYFKTRQKKLPPEFIHGYSIDGEDPVSMDEVRAGNREVGKKHFSRKEVAAALFEKGLKPSAIASLLLSIPAITYAAQPDWSEQDYLDHIMMNLDAYDDATVGAWNRQVRALHPELAAKVDVAESNICLLYTSDSADE